jgi:hypothetical protein
MAVCTFVTLAPGIKAKDAKAFASVRETHIVAQHPDAAAPRQARR